MAALPTGIVVFLMTDVENSSALWQKDAAAMSAAIERLSELVAAVAAETGGIVLKGEGRG